MLSENKTILSIVLLTRKKKCTLFFYFIICIFLHRGDKKTVQYTQEEKTFKKIEILGSKKFDLFLKKC